MNTLEKIKPLLVEQLGCYPEEITPEKTLRELGADSLDDVELAMMFEEEFLIDIPDADMEKWRTVADVMAYLEQKT